MSELVISLFQQLLQLDEEPLDLEPTWPAEIRRRAVVGEGEGEGGGGKTPAEVQPVRARSRRPPSPEDIASSVQVLEVARTTWRNEEKRNKSRRRWRWGCPGPVRA